MLLVVGLGNPGTEYENSRHNIGFKVIEVLASRYKNKNFKSSQFQAQVYEFSIDGEDILAAKPLTFMNSSGSAVKKMLKSFDLKADNLIVVNDDLDIEFAEIRVKKDSSSGGHLGIDSIINSIGTADFYRIRVGIGRPPGRKDPSVFVLEPFKKKEIEHAELVVSKTADAIIDLVKFGLEYTMSKYN